MPAVSGTAGRTSTASRTSDVGSQRGGQRGGASSKGPGASQAAAKANASKQNAAKQNAAKQSAAKKSGSGSQTAGRVPGTSAAAARNTALGRAAEAAKQNTVRNPVTTSGRADAGLYGKFTQSLPSMRPGASVMGSPTSRAAWAPGGWMDMQRAPGGYKSAFTNATGVDAGINWSGSFGNIPALRNLSPQGESLYRAMEDTALRTNQPITVFSGGRFGGKPNHRTGNALDQYMRDPVTGRPVGEDKIGVAAKFPIARRANPAIERTLAGPYRNFAGDVFDTAFQNPGVYPGVADRIRYGGTFGGSVPKDYMHFDVTPGAPMSTQTALRKEAAARAGQGTLSSGAMLAGGGIPSGIMSGERTPQFQGPPVPTRVASAALSSIPKPRPRPDNLRPVVPRPNPRPLQSFVAEDPRASLPPGAFPAARPPVPNMRPLQSFVTGDPRVSMPPGAFPAARMQSPVMGDPRVNMPPGSLPAARMQSPVMGDPRVSMPPAAFPAARPASVFGDPRVAGTPLGAFPAAAQPKLVPPIPKARPPMQGPPRPMGGMSFTPPLPGPQKQMYDRVVQTPGPMPQPTLPSYPGRMPAETYTAPYDRPARMSPFGNVGQEYHEHGAPPTPSQYRDEAPPAAPHPATPGSVTADAGPSIWEQGGSWIKAGTDKLKQQAAENKKAVEEIEKQVGPLTPGKVEMWAWLNGLGGGSKAKPSEVGSNMRTPRFAQSYRQPAPATPQEQIPPRVELMALLDAMKAKGATPEEIAYVEAMASQAA